MSNSDGSRILAAITEATEILRTEGLGSKRLTVRTFKLPRFSAHLPGERRQASSRIAGSESGDSG